MGLNALFAIMSIVYTSGKRKKKAPKKDAYQRQLEAEWEALQALHSKPLEKGLNNVKRELQVQVTLIMDLKGPPGRESNTRRIPSRTTEGGSTAKKAAPQYSGTAMLGVGQLHKSNGVPVFSKEDAVDIARMRR